MSIENSAISADEAALYTARGDEFIRATTRAWADDYSKRQTPAATFPDRVRAECKALADMLIAKNQAYGNSALDPVRVFSKASPVEQLLVRIDDKLSRLARAPNSVENEDVILDLLGYLVLLRLAHAEGK